MTLIMNYLLCGEAMEVVVGSVLLFFSLVLFQQSMTPSHQKINKLTEKIINIAQANEKLSTTDRSEPTTSTENDKLPIRKLLNTGLQLIEIKAMGISAIQFKNEGYSISDLKAIRFNLTDLKTADYSPKELHQSGFSVYDLLTAKFSISELEQSEITVTALDLKKMGMSAIDIKKEGFASAQLKEAGFSILVSDERGYLFKKSKWLKRWNQRYFYIDETTKNIHFQIDSDAKSHDSIEFGIIRSVKKMSGTARLANGSYVYLSINNNEYSLYGQTASETDDLYLLLDSLVSIRHSNLKEAGFKATDLNRLASFKLKDLKFSGYGSKDLRVAGFSASDLLKAGFDVESLKKAGYHVIELYSAGVNVSKLVQTGYTPHELRPLKDYRMSNALRLWELQGKKCNFNYTQLRDAGYSARELRLFSNVQDGLALYQAGYTVPELERAGWQIHFKE